jgi:hypothetical protein
MDYPGTNSNAVFSWQYVSGTGDASPSNFYTYGDFVQFSACPPFSIVMKLTATNSCGTVDQLVYLSLNNGDEEISRSASSNSLSVYPNPATDIVNVSLIDQKTKNTSNLKQESWGQIYDSTGRLRGSVKFIDGYGSFSVNGFDKGIYILRVDEDKKMESYKIVVE